MSQIAPIFFSLRARIRVKSWARTRGKDNGNGKRNGKDMGEGEDKDLNF